MADNTSFILANVAMGFGEYDDADELLHPKMNAPIKDDATTETQYFGFSVPEHNIHGLSYLWHHPNLGTITGGVMAYQGLKSKNIAAELYDQRLFMSDKIITGNIDHYKMQSGYQVDVIEPFKKIRIQYEDTSRKNALDITYTALAPPAMLPNRHHFEQPMKTNGSITLRGRTYKVDGYNVRDRSWGEARPEMPMNMPPIVWLTGVFSDNFSFNCLLADDPTRDPEWAGLYNITKEQVLRGGWIYLNGKYTRIVKASQKTKRDPVHFYPVSHELDVVDENGAEYKLRGTAVASCPSGFWSNVNIYIGLMKWECKGQTGWGDSQECQWGDFVHAMHSKK